MELNTAISKAIYDTEPKPGGRLPAIRNNPTASLWLRLTSVAVFGLVFAEALELGSGKIRGWSFYLTTSEIIFEAALRLIVAALVGIVLATAAAAFTGILISLFQSQRNKIVEWSTNSAVIAVVLLDGRLALFALIKSSYQISEHRGIFDTGLFALYYLAFGIALCLGRSRTALITSLDGLMKPSSARRIAIGTLAVTVTVVVIQFALVRRAPAVNASSVSPRPKSNILLVTFDALSAEDMSAYGYKLPTTPNIESFARNATVFTNFYSASTFTTPSVATMLTGLYPSDTRVFQLEGRLSVPERSLPYLLRSHGFTTGAFFSNPWAYYLGASVGSEFDILPEPVFQEGGLQHIWRATSLLHRDAGFGSRMEEYRELVDAWAFVTRGPENLKERYRAAASFEHARKISAALPDGFFLWVHVMTPHGPYYPDPQERGRFLDARVEQVFEGNDMPKWHYPAREQSKVDQYRLRYDEFILTADRAFGSFISELEKQGKLQNTTVIVSADHGESFEGGIFEHRIPEQTRPVIHIPLIIRTPDQHQHREVSRVADQTALAPTILALAGVIKPDWMAGDSLLPWLTGDEASAPKALAFTQYFEKNRIFEPLRTGTVGVIDGEYQYVYQLDNGKGWLRPLGQSQIWTLDRSPEEPARAASMRSAIFSRFPELKRESK